MHVDAKKIAEAGLLAALSVILVILGAVIETNSLFLIAAASFCVGISIREWGIRFGFGFWLACTLLNFMLAPNKIYGLSFSAMGIYIFISEFMWEKLADSNKIKRRKLCLWMGKYVIFNCLYIPAVLFFPSLLFTKKITGSMLWLILIAGQAGLFVFDRAYVYFQGYIWGKFRKKIMRL